MAMLFEEREGAIEGKETNAESIQSRHNDGRLLLVVLPNHVHVFLSLTQPPHAGVKADKLLCIITLKCQRH